MAGLTRIEVEKKLDRIYKLRKEIYTNNEKISKLREEVVAYMKKNGKSNIRIGEYTATIKHRDKRFADYDKIKEYIDKDVLPKNVLKTSKIETLQINSISEFELKGNKFIKK